MYYIIFILLTKSIYSQDLWKTLMTITATGYEFRPVDISKQLLDTTYASTHKRCARVCALTKGCRTFDFNSSMSGLCRLFEADQTTGEIISSSSSSSLTSIVGSISITSSLFSAFGNTPCNNYCMNNPYLSCNINNTCQCSGYTYWDGTMCQLKKFTGASCTANNQCRTDLNLTCLQFFKCGSLSVLVGTTVAGYGNGTAGNDSMGLNTADGIYVTEKNDLYVAEYRGNRVQRFRIGSRIGTTVAGNGILGSSSSELENPEAVCVDEQTAGVYVADSGNRRIQFWAQNATYGITVAGMRGDLGFTYGVRIDNKGNLYASDYSNSRVLRWSLNSTGNGTTVAGGTSGSGPWSLDRLRQIDFDSTYQYLYITDTGNDRIQMYNLVNTTVMPITVAGGNGNGTAANQLYHPNSMCVSRKTGAVYVADSYNNRIQLWNVGSTQGVTIAGSSNGVSGSGATQLNNPSGVALDINETFLYVADYANHRVQRFHLI